MAFSPSRERFVLVTARDESAVPAGCGAERPGARALSGAPGLDRPNELGIEGAAGTWIRCVHPCKMGARSAPASHIRYGESDVSGACPRMAAHVASER